MKKENSQSFSLVIATYTGVDTIRLTFASLLNQEKLPPKWEIVVVIDGPNEKLRSIVEEAKEQFEQKNISFKIEQFSKNKGRFEARLTGAKLAQYDNILIVDDRVEIPKNYLKFMSSLNQRVAMPDVEENESGNIISFSLSKIRKKLYGKKWGTKFKPFYIDNNNFDQSPKGTTSLWIDKNIFIKACNNIANDLKVSKNVSEDTRILRSLVDSDMRIYKTSKIRIRYNSRNTAIAEFKHILLRGPRFIDYYLHPGRRFFWPLAFFYLLLIPIIILTVLYPQIIVIAFIISLLVGYWLAGKLRYLLSTWLGLWLIVVAFGAGLILGLVEKVKQYSFREM
jgi:glycosyltransferase involved in cell wall biosynthesis